MTKRERRHRSPTATVPHADAVAISNKGSSGGEEAWTAMEHQLDLFEPLLRHYIALVASTPDTAPGDDGDDGAQATHSGNPTGHGALNGKGAKVVTQHSPQEQQGPTEAVSHKRCELLRSFVFPATVSSYLRRVSLLPGEQTYGGEVKRRRPEASPPREESESKLLEKLRSIAEAQLPPFADDSEFIAAHESRYVWRESAFFNSSFRNDSAQLLQLITKAKLDVFLHCRPCQMAAIDLYTQHIATRLQKMRISPRVVRVAQKLQLEQHELETLTYVLVCHCGSAWPLHCGGSGSLIPAALALHNNLSSFQLMHFLADYREHVKQGMLTSDIKFKNSFMDCRLAMPQEVIAALAGDSLSEEQLIRLEKTALAEVLMAERADAATTPITTTTATGALATVSATAVDKTEALHHTDAEDGEEEASHCSSGGSTPNLEALGVDAAPLQGDDENAIETALTERLQTLPLNLQQLQQGSGVSGRNCSVASLNSCVVAGSVLHAPYVNDIEYMDESFKLLSNVVRLRGAESDIKDEEDAMFTPKTKVEAMIRELRGRVRVATAIHRSRTEATLKAGKFLPRIEALSQRLQLSDLEKRIMLLLVGNVVSHDILIAVNGRYVMREGQRVLTVGYILFVLCETLKERVAARKSFYQSGPLLANSVLSLSLDGGNGRTCFNTDLMDYVVDIDRKIVDYLMGTETETAEMVPGSQLYMPVVPMENVVLPKCTTEMVVTMIQHYSLFEQCKRVCGFDEGLGTSTSGLVFLFYGPSGTGKTMLANAVAHELKKRILLVNLLQFKSDAKAPEMLRFIFREAKLNDAMVFFDECEAIFESREANPLVTSILAEFEKYDGLIVLATNKAQLIDEAMNRRISLMVEFRLPDQHMREQIWRAHLPRNLVLHEDVSIPTLALNYELSGGLIRNATLAALSKAVARERTVTPTLCMRDLEEGARLQLRGFFLAAEKPPGASTESYITPKRSLADLVVERQTRQQLDAVARYSKSRSTLFSQWGFSEDACVDQGALYLFYGPSGTGKSLAAEGIAYECAATIRLCNVAELMLVAGLKVHEVFAEGRKLGAIIVFDEAQVLFNHSEQSLHVAKLIHYHAMRYPRPVLFIATTGTAGMSTIDVRATPLIFQQEIPFRMPTQRLRRELWQHALPERMPVADDIDLDELSKAPVSAKAIHAAAFGACCRVAMLSNEERRLTMQMLRDELESMRVKEKDCHPHSLMFA
ncbi:putative AAA family ATPase [Trypanosoma rangeli]|uniref:Putative AAA family ATPase n=1 Tax=Trypanosoma rangeli TaxID=5698 RepID=A0A3R7P0X4_TRYRA|nr:putative AAA family ATPase [Trypanosoma rangeli]RNF10903.1 putative AAA family ATPase [Trypanosoma rangeli]|eukprot:RNF10903.1 putative AAA family ATPase [Trypanosoma rangeli]